MAVEIKHLTSEEQQQSDLRAAVIAGLHVDPKSLPSTLLWDEEGHRLFEAITQSECYYGAQADREILVGHMDEICACIGTDGVLVELGAGSIPHTLSLLEALAARGRNVEYIAHDLCASQLNASLCRLDETLQSKGYDQHIHLHGIIGTYEHFFTWLVESKVLQKRRVVLLWLGNCLGHCSDVEFTSTIQHLMQPLLRSEATSVTLLLAVDGNKDINSITHSYDSPDGTSATFVKNAVQHANSLFKTEMFKVEAWTPVASVHAEESTITWSFRSNVGQSVMVDSEASDCTKDELISLISITKRDEAEVAELLLGQKCRINASWCRNGNGWRWYVIEPQSNTSPQVK